MGQADGTTLWSDDQIPWVYRNEVRRLAKYNDIDIFRSWNSTRLQICPIFRSHVFIRYEDPSSSDTAFIVVYPRTSGKVYLIPLKAGFTTRETGINKE
jgi:hypothetical protein